MFGLIPKRKGLFGAPRGTPPVGGMAGEQPVAAARPPQGVFGSQKKHSVLPYVLAAAEDTIARQMGYQPGGVSRLNDMNAQRQEEAAELAAEQRKRSMGLEDYRAKKAIDRQFGGGADEYTYFEDNAGNRWRQHKATGRVDESPAFIDTTPKEFVHEGMRFSIPNPYATGGGAQGGNPPRVTDEASYNALPAGSQFIDDEGNLRTKGGGASNGTGGFPKR